MGVVRCGVVTLPPFRNNRTAKTGPKRNKKTNRPRTGGAVWEGGGGGYGCLNVTSLGGSTAYACCVCRVVLCCVEVLLGCFGVFLIDPGWVQDSGPVIRQPNLPPLGTKSARFFFLLLVVFTPYVLPLWHVVLCLSLSRKHIVIVLVALAPRPVRFCCVGPLARSLQS